MSKPHLVLTEDELDVLEAVVAGLRRQQGRVPLTYGDTRGGDTVIIRRPPPSEFLVEDPYGGEEMRVTPSPADSPDEAGVFLRAGEDYRIRLGGDEPVRLALALVDAMCEAQKGRPADRAATDALAQVISSAAGGVGPVGAQAIASAVVAAGYRKQDKR